VTDPTVVAFASRPTWEDTDWVVQASREDMLKDFQHWDPKIRTLMANVQKPDIWALFNHLPASIYYSTEPLVCLVGDAAHASTPHQGSGAGMCVEDAYILSQVLSKCQTREELEIAFKAYDAVRRPRSQEVVKTSREAGQLWDLEGEGVDDDLQALEQNATSRMGWIWDHDISVDLQAAQQILASA
jgi:salicylate hydroxylase